MDAIETHNWNQARLNGLAAEATVTPNLTCMQEHEGDCAGAVEYRESLSGTGVSYPRCDAHWSRRLDLEERLRRDYPDSPHAPSWFDPTYAGECWDDGE